MTLFLRPTDLFSRRLALVGLVLVPLAFGVYAILLDQDANWDLRNYHWYNPYAWLTDRWSRDILPAHIPTFYNPTLDVPFFLAAQALPARAAGFLMGLVQGLNVVPLYLIGLRLLAPVPAPPRRLAALALAVVGLVGGGHLGLVGTTFYDNVVSLFVLGAVALVLACDPRHIAGFALAGLLAGAGAGLKLPSTVFAIGLGVALLLSAESLRARLVRTAVFGFGALAGLAATAGHWMLFLWREFGNPIFPYFNSLFASPMGIAASYRDTRFIPENAAEWLLFPLITTVDSLQAGEIEFRDGRIAAAFLALLITLGLAFVRRPAAELVARPAAIVLIAMSVVSYLVWLGLFAIYRYLIPLEMLAPVVLVAAVGLWPVALRARAGLAAAVLALLVVTAAPGSWGRVPWGPRFVDTVAPPLPDPAQALVLMLGYAPTAWVIPAFPPATAFVRVQGFGLNPEDGDIGLNRRVAERIAAHRGAVYTLAGDGDRDLAATLLARYGLAPDPAGCRRIVSNLADYAELCPVQPLSLPP
jgi:hypothetical protein